MNKLNGKSPKKIQKEDHPIEIKPDFNASYSDYSELIYRLLFLQIRQPADTSEAVQDVFLKYLLTKKEFSSEDEKKSWFIQTAEQTADEYFRTKMHKTIRPSDLKGMNLPFAIDKYSEAVFSLPQKYQSLMYFKYGEKKSEEEIAELIGKPLSIVKRKIQSAEKKLSSHFNAGLDNIETELMSAYLSITGGNFGGTHSYNELKRKLDEKGYAKKQKAKFIKHRIDKYIPYVALVCVLFVVYAFFAVTNGWLTGNEFIESTELAEKEGYVYEGEDKQVEAAKKYFSTGEIEDVPEEEKKADTVVLYSLYDNNSEEIKGLSAETTGFELWSLMQEKGFAPENAELISYSINDDILYLNFSIEIAEVISESDKEEKICQSFNSFFKCSSVQIDADGDR